MGYAEEIKMGKIKGWKLVQSDNKYKMYKNIYGNALYVKNWQVFDYNGKIKNTGKFSGKILNSHREALDYATNYMRTHPNGN